MIALALACSAPAPRAEAFVADGGVRVVADAPIARVTVYAGDRRVAVRRVPSGQEAFVPAVAGTHVEVTFAGGGVSDVTIGEARDAPTAGAGAIAVVDAVFPALPDGRSDRARARDHVAIGALDVRDEGRVRYGWRGVTVAAVGADVDAVVRQRVLDGDGRPVAWMAAPAGERAGDAVLVHAPAEGAVIAALPVFVDRREATPGVYVFETTVTPLSGGAPTIDRREVRVTRGSPVWLAGLAAAGVGAVAGLGLVAARGRAFLAASRTSDLTTIAMFAAVQFVWGVGSQLFASAATTVLGPFAPIVTGLVDEAVRTVLLATLLALVPRPGAAAATIVVGYLLRLLALGAVTPIDAVWLGDAVIAHEGALWLAGVTRPGGQGGTRAVRTLRLAAGLAPAALLTAAAGMAVHVAYFRLFYAPWYVAMVLLGPSFAYVIAACAVAVPFADRVRAVRP